MSNVKKKVKRKIKYFIKDIFAIVFVICLIGGISIGAVRIFDKDLYDKLSASIISELKSDNTLQEKVTNITAETITTLNNSEILVGVYEVNNDIETEKVMSQTEFVLSNSPVLTRNDVTLQYNNFNYEFTNRVVELVNIKRAKEGLIPLTLNDTITLACEIRSNELLSQIQDLMEQKV